MSQHIMSNRLLFKKKKKKRLESARNSKCVDRWLYMLERRNWSFSSIFVIDEEFVDLKRYRQYHFSCDDWLSFETDRFDRFDKT